MAFHEEEALISHCFPCQVPPFHACGSNIRREFLGISVKFADIYGNQCYVNGLLPITGRRQSEELILLQLQEAKRAEEQRSLIRSLSEVGLTAAPQWQRDKRDQVDTRTITISSKYYAHY